MTPSSPAADSEYTVRSPGTPGTSSRWIFGRWQS